MYSLDVQLAQTHYPIYIGHNILEQKELLLNHLAGDQILIVTNQTIAALYLEKLKSIIEQRQCDIVILPEGEQYKNLDTINKIFDSLLLHQHTRKTTLIALGGGVIGDMTGFAAACYMRGVRYIQIPTTLLSQVDSAIGGKTGVNHPFGKNMIGAFYQPSAVISDINTLSSLPKRVFGEGIAEIIKYGLIQDADFFVWLEQNISKLLQKDPIILQQAIQRSCKIKAAIVMADERESGIRILLNLGHTFGHAIENGLGYGAWLHGEAVGLGLLMAADLSVRLDWIKSEVAVRIKNLLIQIGLPVLLPSELSASKVLELMARDKKNIEGRLRLILLKGIGKAVVTEDVPIKMVQETIKAYSR